MVPSTSSSEKQTLRRHAREKRHALANADFALKLAECAEDLALKPGTVVGAYHAHQGEADPSELLARLVELGMCIAFPRVVRHDAALDFHIVPNGEILMPGRFGIPEPLAHWPHVMPQLLLVPLLAFDARGHRLGYGGGYYDRTLEALNVPAIGIAYAGQEATSLPVEPHDRRLDAILTENGLRQFS